MGQISAGYWLGVSQSQPRRLGHLTVAKKVFAGPEYPKPTRNMAAMMPLASDQSVLPPFSKVAQVMQTTRLPQKIKKYETIYPCEHNMANPNAATSTHHRRTTTPEVKRKGRDGGRDGTNSAPYTSKDEGQHVGETEFGVQNHLVVLDDDDPRQPETISATFEFRDRGTVGLTCMQWRTRK